MLIMDAFKLKSFNSELSNQNSKYKDVCPRCTRSLSDKGERNSPGLLNYYKTLCKSSKCFIHKRNFSNKKKPKLKCKLKKGKCGRNKWEKLLVEPNITDPNVQCRVREFESQGKSFAADIEPQLYTKIETTVAEYDLCRKVKLEDVVGHGLMKEVINRTVIWPLKKPEIFKGLRSAPKGVLLFGPPGTGKTLIGQCIAFETKSTFFNVSGASLTSKWMGESEKLVRTMFVVAKARQPSVIFIDDVDSILSQRTPDENGSSRRMKNEFFVQMDGSTTRPEDRIMVIGATNRPQELDEAARRRFLKRFYIPLPDEAGRKELLIKLLQYECHSLEEIDINDIVSRTEGYSIADLKNLSQEAAMGPIKLLSANAIIRLKPDKIRPISLEDFLSALQLIKPSVSKAEIRAYENWDSLYGYGNECRKRLQLNL